MEQVKPALQRFFEAAAAVMELDHGQQRLELIFEDGRLLNWWTHAERRGAKELGRFDESAAFLAR